MAVSFTPSRIATHAHGRAPSIVARIRAALALSHQRRALAALSDEALDDIGVTRLDAHAEATRPVWDVPAHWRG